MSKNKVGLGTFPLAGVFNPISPRNAEYIVKKFIDEGGYYIDTAPLYGNGEVEKLLGRVLKSIPRDKFYLITKTVKIVDGEGKLIKSGKKKDIVNGLAFSLKRLRLDYVDQLMVHSPDSETPIHETLEAMETLQNEGQVMDLSVSNVDLKELKEYNATNKIRFVENRFSLINRSVDTEFEKYLLDSDIKLIPYHLLEIGLLTGIAFENFSMQKSDLRNNLPYWNPENQKVIFEWVRNKLAPIAKSLGITIGQLNIAWALHQKIIDFVIVGTTNPEYLSINLKASSISLDESTLSGLETVYHDLVETIEKNYNKTVREFRGLNNKYY